jgi:hypothetical protein
MIVTGSKRGKPLMGTLENEDDASVIMLAIRNRHLTENREQGICRFQVPCPINDLPIGDYVMSLFR